MSKRKSRSVPEAPNARAVCALESWLDAVGIAHFPPSVPGADLMVETANGPTIPVSVVVGKATLPNDPNFVVLNGYNLLDRDLPKSFGEFHNLTQIAGYGQPEPVNRGPAPDKKKLSIEEYPVDVLCRHREFRQAPNLPTSAYDPYRSLIQKFTRHFYNVNKRLCTSTGYDADDLQQYALMFATAFLHHTKLLGEGREEENQKMMLTFLRQRFAEFHERLTNLVRNMVPDEEAAVMNTPVDGLGDEADETYRISHDKIRVVVTNKNGRKKKAAELLEAEAQRIGPEKFRILLEQAAAEHPCPETRDAARRYLGKL